MLVAAWVLDAHQLGLPAFLQYPAQRGEHAVGGGGLVVLLEQTSDPEHLGASEPVPGHGFVASRWTSPPPNTEQR
jgi:hypothetical protein